MAIYSELKKRRDESVPCRDYLTAPIAYAAQDMETAIKNNIKSHFCKRQFHYLSMLNPLWKPGEVAKRQKEINQPGSEVTKDEKLCLPDCIVKTIWLDLAEDPCKFLKPMWNMLHRCERERKEEKERGEEKMKRGKKVKKKNFFSLLPMKRGFITGYMSVSHGALEVFDFQIKTKQGNRPIGRKRKNSPSSLESSNNDGSK